MSDGIVEWKGNITAGRYSADVWYAFADINHKQIQSNILETISKPELFEGFELYIVGGALETWKTWDIDWTLVGPYNPTKIKKAIDWIYECGFKNGIYPDACYTEELFDLHAWQNGSEMKDRWVYRNHNSWSKLGEEQYMEKFEEAESGLWKSFHKCPYPKNIEKDKEGYKYKKPLKII